MKKIKLRVDVLNQLQKEHNLTNTELAEKMGISRSRLWRAKLPETHPEYCSPGEDFITGALDAFPELSFDDLFFLDEVCIEVHKNNKSTA